MCTVNIQLLWRYWWSWYCMWLNRRPTCTCSHKIIASWLYVRSQTEEGWASFYAKSTCGLLKLHQARHSFARHSSVAWGQDECKISVYNHAFVCIKAVLFNTLHNLRVLKYLENCSPEMSLRSGAVSHKSAAFAASRSIAYIKLCRVDYKYASNYRTTNCICTSHTHTHTYSLLAALDNSVSAAYTDCHSVTTTIHHPWNSNSDTFHWVQGHTLLSRSGQLRRNYMSTRPHIVTSVSGGWAWEDP